MASIALVVLDTLRKDLFDELFDWLPGLAVEKAYAPSNWTAPVHASMFTGRYPSEHGVHVKQKSLEPVETVLAETLRDRGFRTVGISTNTNISRYWGFDRGFDRFYERSETGRVLSDDDVDWISFIRDADSRTIWDVIRACLRSGTPLRSLYQGVELKYYDHSLLGSLFSDPSDHGARSVRRVVSAREVSEREFLFVNLMEVHSPYDPPDEYWPHEGVRLSGIPETLGDAPSTDRIEAAYRAACRYLADEYERLFEILREKYDYAVTCSDHGELLGEHGYYSHEYSLYPELVDVPLVISGSTVTDRSVDNLISLTGVYDLVNDLATGASVSEALEAASDDRCYTEFHGLLPWRRERYVSEGYSEELLAKYDTPLAGAADLDDYVFGSLDGYVGDDPSLLSAARDRRSRIEDDSFASGERPDDLPDEIQDKLEDLGYL